MRETEKILQETAELACLLKSNHDEVSLEKTNLFAKKIIEEEYTVGFAGHFSAGKSSMINALIGHELLPSSPIPTSANVVKVKKTTTDYAIIRKTDGSAAKYNGQNFSDAVRTFSKNGTEVAMIEIGHATSNLPDGITVMDTPGVDSTDDAHRLSTESALHLADIVFYTMDYNHVQSEVNFRFTKDLMRYNPNVYLIINQIDKHRESELHFSTFKKSVEDSFSLWGVEPKGIFYTSLKDPHHTDNDFDKVKEIIDDSIENSYEHFIVNANQTLLKLRNEHNEFLMNEVKEMKETYASIVNVDEWETEKKLTDELFEMKHALTLLSGNGFSVAFEKNRNNLLDNAAITPYETRELLKLYLESLSSRFKVGLIFSTKKTSEEQIARKNALSNNLNELVHTHIEIHLKTLMKKTLQEAGVLTDERSLNIDEVDMTIPFVEIEKEFVVADVITGDTVLNYSERMKTIIIRAFKRLTDDWKHNMADVISRHGNQTSGILEHQIHVAEEKLQAIHQVKHAEEKLTQFCNDDISFNSESKELLTSWRKEEVLHFSEYSTSENELVDVVSADLMIDDSQTENSEVTVQLEEVCEKAKRTASEVKNIPGFEEIAQFLTRKTNRLEQQELTVALFGAFSAGKSSFSNALIGENVLPVSPNPTTATINRIRPVSIRNLDKTADIKFKSIEIMTEDVIRSFDMLGIEVRSLKEAFQKADEITTVMLVDEKKHVHKSFISAFKTGYPLYAEQLGSTITVEKDEFTKYVAEEQRSCFVASIDFYFDCELTRKGITIVDTPGADSINARHTDVAFDYIRNADAILFVTYYNHAFAKADREFLVQLGRVKDSFEMDKMFFIVNAIDLANNEEESEGVKQFVSTELNKFGIRNPRVHGISSLQALDAKIGQTINPMMNQFEKEFYHFLKNDLIGISVKVLEDEVLKTVERLKALIVRTEMNRNRKAERLLELNKVEGELRNHFSVKFAHVLIKATQNEISELVYYLLQRVFLRFPDFFRESYNPSVFVNKSADAALKFALDETVQMVGFDLTQELKVTNHRILTYMKKQLYNRQQLELQHIQQLDDSISPAPYESNDATLLSFQAPFLDTINFASVNRLYKNGKSFFEKGESNLLKDRLEELLKKDSGVYLEKEKEKLLKWAENWIESEAEGLRQHLLTGSLNQLQLERDSLSEIEVLEEWRLIADKLQ